MSKSALLFPYKDAFICIALPIMVNEYGQTERLAEVLEKFIANLGFKTIESHKVFVHRSLTREIMVYEKT